MRSATTALATVALVAAALCVAADAPPVRATAAAIGAGSITRVSPGAPGAATAVLANITMVDGAAAGYITADRCSTLTPTPQTRSNGNHLTTTAIANLSVIPLDPDGTFCIYNQAPVNLAVDVQGHLAPPSTDGLVFVPASPTRLLDTRIGATTPLAAGSISVVHATPGAAAVLANITMVDGAAAGYITADRCSTLTPTPQTRSNGNHLTTTAIANLSVIPLDPDGTFCIYNQAPVNLAVDVQGTFSTDDPAGLRLTTTSPTRRLDTREAGGRPAAGSITVVHAVATPGAAAVLANITMVDGATAGYITADRCSTLTPTPQTRSNGNHLTTTAIANLSVIPLDPDGTFCIYNQAPVNLAVDVQGTFSTDGTDELHLLSPSRVLDTRPPPGSGPPLTSCTSVVHIGDSTSVGLISSSMLPDPADRVDAQYRRVGVANPRMEISGARSIVERLPGQANAFEVAAALVAQGYHGCWVFALGTTDTANVAAGSIVTRRERIDKMMRLVGDDPVMWVNVRTTESSGSWSNANMQLWNAELALALDRYPNLQVYDWAGAAELGWFSADRVHYTPDGYRQRARLIADALASALPG